VSGGSISEAYRLTELVKEDTVSVEYVSPEEERTVIDSYTVSTDAPWLTDNSRDTDTSSES